MINTINQRQRFPFWCHSCQRETFPTENESGIPVCGFCRNTFIEEINSFNQDNFRNQFRGGNINQGLIPDSQIPTQGRRAQSQTRAPRIESITVYGSGNRGNQVISLTFTDFPMGQQGTTGQSIVDHPILSLMFGGGNNQIGGFLSRHRDGDAAFENLLNLLMQIDQNRYGSPPASEKEIKLLKREKIDKINLSKYVNIECSVCRDQYKLDEEIINMPCAHIFHTDCLMPWLNEHNSCPVCRFELKTDDPQYENRKRELRRTLSNSRRDNHNNDTNNITNGSGTHEFYPRRSGSHESNRRR